MHKRAKITTTAILGALIAGGASGCGSKADITLWTGFGAAYTQAVNSLITRYQEQTGVIIENTSAGSYDNLQSKLSNSVSTASYPNFANGYPDHFAGYIASGILLELDPYIEAYNEANDTDLLADYYDNYMEENKMLKYKADGTPYVMGLPFNKSTEVMAYNGYFVEYAQALNSEITVPATWDEWTEMGPKYLAVMDTLYGKYLYAKVDPTDADKHTDFETVAEDGEKPEGKELLLDCTKVTKDKFRLLTWDSTDNMFITITRQWGATYTSYTSEDAKKYQHGWAEYARGENREKTIAAVDYFRNAYNEGIFGLPKNISDSSYSSDAFKGNKCMFTICSSGGLSYNIQTGSRLKLAPIPYKDEDHKLVISQGTNLALFDQGTDDEKQKAFDAMVAFTTGDLQGSWAVETGYFPASKSATNSEAYQELISNPQDNQIKVAYQESAKLNEEVYMNSTLEKTWTKFVDPGFVGSSAIRQEVATVISIALGSEKTTEQILDETMTRLSTYDPNNKK